MPFREMETLRVSNAYEIRGFVPRNMIIYRMYTLLEIHILLRCTFDYAECRSNNALNITLLNCKFVIIELVFTVQSTESG